VVTPLIVGFSGPAGAGKDDAAKIVVDVLQKSGISAAQYSFAMPLKEVCAFVFGMTPEEMSDRKIKEEVGRFTYGMTNRKVMQLVGTESFRQIFNENIWVDFAERAISRMGVDVIVISDVRFENEAEWVKRNGFLFHIDPEGREGFEKIGESSHSSEAGYSTTPTSIIENKGTLGEFVGKIEKITRLKIQPAYTSIRDQVLLLTERMSEEVQSIKQEAICAVNEDI